MRLAAFILANIEPILMEWESHARSLVPGENMTVVALRDDLESILRASARDMLSLQSLEQQARKSKGAGDADGPGSEQLSFASELHGVERVNSGFHITDVVSEYRALRASVLRLWRESLPQPDVSDIDDISRFNEALDQSLARSVSSYSQRIDESRQMFLAILSHDLRNPLSTIRMAAHVVSVKNEDPITAKSLSMIKRSTDTMQRLISDLIDFSSSSLGQAMPLNRGLVDLEELCCEVVASFRTTYPERALNLLCDDGVHGFWDPTRMRQIIANLMGNAIQHGSSSGQITLSVASEKSGPDESIVVLSVHNDGPPIQPHLLSTLFEPMKRYATHESAEQRTQGSVGLGLYIVRQIVDAKGGTVKVTSTAEEGTTFTVRIPRFLPIDGDKPAGVQLASGTSSRSPTN